MMSLNRMQAVFKKELIQLRRDKMTFRMMVLIPIIQLLLFGYAINTNIRDIPVGVVDQSNTGLSRVLLETVEATQVVKVTHFFTDVSEADKAMSRSEIKAYLYIPHDLSQRLARHPSVGLGLPPSSEQQSSRALAQWVVDGSDTVIASAVKSLRSMPLAELLDKPANKMTPTFEVTLLFNPEQRSEVNILPGLVAVILTMTMIMFTSAAIVRERERGNMEMLINTPVHPIELMLGKIIPYIFIGAIQVSLILSLGHALFNVPISGRFIDLGLITLLFIIASLALGLVISTLAQNQLQSMQMTVFILLPSILLSGFMFPYEAMPELAQTIAEALPATHFMRLIRGVVLRGDNVTTMYTDIYWLIGFIVIGMTVASLHFKKRLA